MYIVSSCLLGENCKYDGGNNRNEAVCKFLEDKVFLKVCPESAGKLPCPRPPAEYVGEVIINKEGKNVTEAFKAGALAELQQAFVISKGCGVKIEGAILKANSPSCGKDKIYDGTFTGKLVDGDGCFVRLLKENGIAVYTEEDVEAGRVK